MKLRSVNVKLTASVKRRIHLNKDLIPERSVCANDAKAERKETCVQNSLISLCHHKVLWVESSGGQSLV